MIAVNSYRLPVPRVNLREIDRTSSPAHTGKLRYAIDFIVPEEIVTYIKDDSRLGGSDVSLESL
jgi:hypothetical protein